jgi:hypothetical protein
MTVRVKGVGTRHVNFVESAFIRRKNFTDRYVKTNNALPGNNRFRFQGNAVNINLYQSVVSGVATNH